MSLTSTPSEPIQQAARCTHGLLQVYLQYLRCTVHQALSVHQSYQGLTAACFVFHPQVISLRLELLIRSTITAMKSQAREQQARTLHHPGNVRYILSGQLQASLVSVLLLIRLLLCSCQPSTPGCECCSGRCVGSPSSPGTLFVSGSDVFLQPSADSGSITLAISGVALQGDLHVILCCCHTQLYRMSRNDLVVSIRYLVRALDCLLHHLMTNEVV